MIDNLKNLLSQALPGKAAQYKMAHAVRVNHAPPPPDAQIACVLVLLYPRNKDWHIVLIERMSNKRHDRHSGQISFPGGKLEDRDPSLAAGALREANEEVGVIQEDIEILGQLTEMYIPVSNFLVHPFVGKLDYTPLFIPQPSEVKSILEVPLNILTDPKTINRTELRISNDIILKNVPYYNFQNHIVWGATAMMLSEFLEVLKGTEMYRTDP